MFDVKDSGKREEFDSGMVRDTQDGKIEYDRIFEGPMVDRWAAHLTKAVVKYPDNEDGTANWTLAKSKQEMRRFRKSAARHFRQWLRGDQDEDHGAAVMFNINGHEHVRARLESPKQPGPESEPALEKPAYKLYLNTSSGPACIECKMALGSGYNCMNPACKRSVIPAHGKFAQGVK